MADGQPIDWWFVFKFNAKAFPGCADAASRNCLFGGKVQDKYKNLFGQQFVYASNLHPALQQGSGGCLGDAVSDPVGATFAEVYTHSTNFVLWNDQFKGDPLNDRDAPWAHSKGLLAWDDAGEGFVMQVTTPSWPGSGSQDVPRQHDGNTLGCVNDNDVEVSQHFFSLKAREERSREGA